MRCSFCGRRAAYSQRYAGLLLCDRCLAKSVERRFRRGIAEHSLISPGERIVLAVSGGKDSVACMHLLTEYCKRRGCRLLAVTIDEGIAGYRDESIEVALENAELLGVEHKVVSFKQAFGATLDEMVKLLEERKTGLGACTYCGILRRSLLNQAAREAGAQKLATAHNLDDEVQAVMLNYIRGDFVRLHRLGPAYSPRQGFVPRIKPMREIPEKEVAAYALLKGIKVHLGVCPYAGGIHTEIRDFINRLEENHPNSKFMVLRMFDRMRPHLAQAVPEFDIGKCERCSEPTSANVCKSCELLEQLGISPTHNFFSKDY
ncbi:MAG: TIGR00269 family protein [Candidatus Hadarchaeota archaeon]